MMPDSTTRYYAARRVTLIGAIVNAALGFFKIVLGIMGHSQALVADGIHSLSDLITDLLVVIAAKYGSVDADHDHPYGHQRIETVATVALALLLILVGLAIILEGGWQLMMKHGLIVPSFYVIIAALISTIANEALFRYTLLVASRIKSELLRANAWHSRGDALSSLIVLVGVVGAYIGYPFLDKIAAILVGGMVIKMGWDLAWNSLRELVDTGVEPQALSKIEDMIRTIDGVNNVYNLRSRTMGGQIYLDVHVLVDTMISVSEAHFIAETVRAKLITEVDDVVDATIHVDPEDERNTRLNLERPDRQQLLDIFQARWQALAYYDNIARIDLHYLQRTTIVDIIFNLDQALVDIEQYQQAVADMNELTLRYYYQPTR